MTKRIAPVLALAAVAAILLAGAPAPAPAHEFEAGYYYATGTIEENTGLGFTMAGSHLLKSTYGATIANLTSSTYDLQAYNGLKVTVFGWTAHTAEGHALLLHVYALAPVTPLVSVPFTSIDKGAKSGYDATDAADRNFVIRDPSTWAIFHHIHHPDAGVPSVDFKLKHQVLASFAGPQHLVGTSHSITKVQKSGTTLRVTAKTVSPSTTPPLLKDPFFPYNLATTMKSTGKVFFNGKPGRVLKIADLQSSLHTIFVLGDVSLAPGIDPAKVKVGTFAVHKYMKVMWPGVHPGHVTPLNSAGTWLEEFTPVTDDPSDLLQYYAIVWEDKNDDGINAGEPFVTTEAFLWKAKSPVGNDDWQNEAGDHFTQLIQVSLSLEPTS